MTVESCIQILESNLQVKGFSLEYLFVDFNVGIHCCRKKLLQTYKTVIKKFISKNC
jgi:hypothetical protein